MCLCVCLIKVGGLGLWKPNLCLNFVSSLWPWELLCWTECYLFGHLIHIHKWPLGAVSDKQTDWIACMNVCGFSPVLSSRPLGLSLISPQGNENRHADLPHVFMCTNIIYMLMSSYTCMHILFHTALIDLLSVFIHSSKLQGSVRF